MFRISKLAEESSIIASPFMKEKIVFFILKNVLLKINQLSELTMLRSHQSLPPSSSLASSLIEWEAYSRSADFQQFAEVINEYQAKYSKHY